MRAILLVVMIVLILGVDVLFLRGADHTTRRLIVNVGIVGAFGAGYYAFLR